MKSYGTQRVRGGGERPRRDIGGDVSEAVGGLTPLHDGMPICEGYEHRTPSSNVAECGITGIKKGIVSVLLDVAHLALELHERLGYFLD